MPFANALDEGERIMRICNACRYCEGYCAVFPAMEKRIVFARGDLNYLANLCHDCGECYHACQYAPPHEFAVNVPDTMAKIRSMSYRQYAWPMFLSNAFNRRSVATSLGIAATIAIFLLICSGAFGHLGPASDFYQIIPHRRLAMGFGLVSLIVAALLFAGFVRFWRDVGETFSDLVKPKALTSALDDILSLRYLGSGGVGCTDNAGRHSPWRRYFHQFTFYGFMLCFAATCAGTFDHYVLHSYAPYPLLSTPVILGTLGGIGLLIGPAGLYLLKHKASQHKIETGTSSMDTSFIVLLFSTSATGLVLLALRNSHFMGEWLCIHLALVMTLFLTLPYGKFVHGIYRSAALVKYALEHARSRYRLSD